MSERLLQIANAPGGSDSPARPPWLKVRLRHGDAEGVASTRERMRGAGLNTVCEEAACPNLSECWSKGHATVMILGRVCTRACAFCNVETGRPDALDPDEPRRLATQVAELDLEHVVITSVDRDDLPDGGAGQFVACIEALRVHAPATTVEVLTPDFRHKDGALERVVDARPDVFNHNLETVERLYRRIQPGSSYHHSLGLLERVKTLDPESFTKSGIMVGLGEDDDEVIGAMDDLRGAGVDFLTIGQYLRPSPKHAPVTRYVTPEAFRGYADEALARGFLLVSASPFTRSSHHAGADFRRLQAARQAKAEPS